MLGLTPPGQEKRWYGVTLGKYFFRLADGDRYLAVLRGYSSLQILDAIPFEGNRDDPRADIERLGTLWVSRRELVRHG